MSEEEGDRISRLPDDVICHILSFLPTKYSFRTRLLSTRWKFLFALVPILDLDNSTDTSNSDDDDGQISFVNFVNNLLAVYKVTEMTRFRLLSWSDEELESDDLVSWILSVIHRKVRELDIDIFGIGENVYLPPEVFNSQMLTVLKLEGFFEIEFPFRGASLPCLKTLHLCRAVFYNSSWRIVSASVCRILEDLCLDNCRFDYFEVLDISHPLLRKLSIQRYHNKELVLNVPSLVDFEYLYNTTSAIAVSGETELKSLDKARLHLYGDDGDVVAKLFALVSHARHLSLNQPLTEALQGCSPTLPTFHKLTILEVGQVSKLIPDILNRCPLLEVLIFTKGSSSEVDDTCIKCNENVPSCVTMSLKEIIFREFTMQESEWNLVEYFLTNAQVLEKLNIRSSLCLERRHLLSRELSTLYKFSRGCKIEIKSDGETED